MLYYTLVRVDYVGRKKWNGENMVRIVFFGRDVRLL